MAQVKLVNLTKHFPGKLKAVDSLNLEIADKEFCVLVGPSGCGKSTTLRMIAGLEEITAGEVIIGDRCVNKMAPKDRDIAMVFQNYALYPHLNVYKNMAFGLKLRRFSKDEIDQRVRRAAEILDITILLNRSPKALSGGERQRVAVGRAIVREPKVFLFDEPLSNLDAKLRVQLRLELTKLHKRLDTTMIYVTHDQVEAMTMGDRIVVMNEGVVQQVDDPVRLYEQPANMFVAGFIGSPPMNFIKGRCELENGRAFFSEGAFRLILPDPFAKNLNEYDSKEVVFGVRPEDILAVEAEDEIDLAGDSVKAKVEVVEPMGAESYVHLNAGQSSFIARFPASSQLDEGGEQTVRFQLAKTHVFDALTKQVIV